MDHRRRFMMNSENGHSGRHFPRTRHVRKVKLKRLYVPVTLSVTLASKGICHPWYRRIAVRRVRIIDIEKRYQDEEVKHL